ncbi:MAG: DUF1102 domain-containing protein [Halobacteriales archaeon]|nr:DUF1102 domain-containing protein [Halobacteriales archaeon]
MERRKFLIGIGSATVGGSALLGSGAFTRVESQRRVKIEVAEDPDAYLGLDKCEGSPNGSYTYIDEDGHLAVEMSPDNPTIGETPLGEGINSDSFSWFDDVFQICNQGKQAVCIWIEAEPNPELADPPEEYADEPRIAFYDGDRESLLTEDNAFLLPVGACKCVGIRTMTKGLSAGDQLVENDEVVIHADADADCEGEELCPDVEAEYTCTVRDPPEEGGEPIGTRHMVTNNGNEGTQYGWAIIDSPSDFRSIADGNFVGAFNTSTFVADASAPQDGVVFWEADCSEEKEDELGLTTYGELVSNGDVSTDLDDFVDDRIDPDAYAVLIGGYPVTEQNRVFCDELVDNGDNGNGGNNTTNNA